MIDPKLMNNDTESPREGTSSFIYILLTFVDSEMYNMNVIHVDMINLKKVRVFTFSNV